MPPMNAGGSLDIRGIMARLLRVWEGESTAMLPSLICHGCPRVPPKPKSSTPAHSQTTCHNSTTFGIIRFPLSWPLQAYTRVPCAAMCSLDSAYSISMKPAEVRYDLVNKVGNQTSGLNTLVPQVSTVTSCTSVRAPGCGGPLA